MLGLGLASSHAPAIFCPAEVWPKVYAAIPDYMKESQPHTAKLETSEVIREYIARIDRHFETLRAQLEAFKPDAVVFVGDDEGDLFNLNHFPTFSVFCGDEVWGSTTPYYMGEPSEKSRITMPCDAKLGRFILEGLLERGFDPSFCQAMQPVGRPERGISHMVAYPYPRLLPRRDVPIVPVFINEYFPPMPNGERCWNLGRALREILDAWPGRVAIYASGGLSHDPAGPRAGWIDEPLDRWVLEQIRTNQHHRLKELFKFDSASLRGGSGEIRAWISVAAACDRPAVVLDYIPCHHAKTGLSFAYWPWNG
jgi:protocatechuate 4,5-dioxygenase beta chain